LDDLLLIASICHTILSLSSMLARSRCAAFGISSKEICSLNARELFGSDSGSKAIVVD
jgi:hypothetical protein